jgi:hypothetical protein
MVNPWAILPVSWQDAMGATPGAVALKLRPRWRTRHRTRTVPTPNPLLPRHPSANASWCPVVPLLGCRETSA